MQQHGTHLSTLTGKEFMYRSSVQWLREDPEVGDMGFSSLFCYCSQLTSSSTFLGLSIFSGCTNTIEDDGGKTSLLLSSRRQLTFKRNCSILLELELIFSLEQGEKPEKIEIYEGHKKVHVVLKLSLYSFVKFIHKIRSFPCQDNTIQYIIPLSNFSEMQPTSG